MDNLNALEAAEKSLGLNTESRALFIGKTMKVLLLELPLECYFLTCKPCGKSLDRPQTCIIFNFERVTTGL